jgi:hypothetical protein
MIYLNRKFTQLELHQITNALFNLVHLKVEQFQEDDGTNLYLGSQAHLEAVNLYEYFSDVAKDELLTEG